MPKQISNISDLTPDPINANKGTERGRYMVESSLREAGAGRSIVVDKDGRIIAGNKTLEAWAEMGGEIEVVHTDGQRLVVVQRDDLDLADSAGKARTLAYYDNRAGEVGLVWDAERIIADVTSGLDLSAMFRREELEELVKEVTGQHAADFLDDLALGEEGKANTSDFENPYVGLVFPANVDQRNYVLRVVAQYRTRYELATSTEVLIHMCEYFEEQLADGASSRD